MALQGTLDTFALPDVLRLLATTKKTGRLLVQGDQGNGSLHLRDGAVVGGETSLAQTEASHEVLFELLRLQDGSFLFDQDADVDATGDGVEVEDVVEAAEAAHAEWLDLSSVVPSLDVGLRLADDLPDDSTTIDRERWKLIVAIGSGTTVRSLGSVLGLRELPVLRATRSLVDDGLANVTEAHDVAEGQAVDAGSVQGLDTSAGTASWQDDAGVVEEALPSLDDDADAVDLFDTSDALTSDEALPEPLPDGSLGGPESTLSPAEAAILEQQLDGLDPDQRSLVEQAAESGDPDTAERLLDQLPEGAIDRDLMRRFLGLVAS